MPINLVEMLRDHGLNPIDKRVPGRSGSFNPQGLVLHHTASPAGSGDVPCLRICTVGRPDVPGPLCQILLGRAGTIIVITDGRANHPGANNGTAVDRAIRGLPPIMPPGPDTAGTNSAGKFYGIEAENNGVGEPWPNVQMDNYFALTEAFCSEFGWNEYNFVAHKELTRRKIDPSFDMRWYRTEYLGRISTEQPKEWDEMASKEEIDAVVKARTDVLEKQLKDLTARLDALAVGPAYAGHNFEGIVKMLPKVHKHLAGDQTEDSLKLRKLIENIYNKVT